MNLTHHKYVCHLSNGARVMYNRIQGHSVEDSMCLRPLTKEESLELAQLLSDDDGAFAEECELDKVASEQQTELW